MGNLQFFSNAAKNIDEYNRVKEWYKYYGWIMKNLHYFVYFFIFLLVVLIIERYFMHRKVDVANANI